MHLDPESEQVSFLSEKGVVDIICELGENDGMRFSELEHELTISSSTLSERLDRGMDLALIDPEAKIGERGSVKFYRLTTVGRLALKLMDLTGVRRSYFKIKHHREELEANMSRLYDLIEDEEPTQPGMSYDLLEDLKLKQGEGEVSPGVKKSEEIEGGEADMTEIEEFEQEENNQ